MRHHTQSKKSLFLNHYVNEESVVEAICKADCYLGNFEKTTHFNKGNPFLLNIAKTLLHENLINRFYEWMAFLKNDKPYLNRLNEIFIDALTAVKPDLLVSYLDKIIELDLGFSVNLVALQMVDSLFHEKKFSYIHQLLAHIKEKYKKYLEETQTYVTEYFLNIKNAKELQTLLTPIINENSVHFYRLFNKVLSSNALSIFKVVMLISEALKALSTCSDIKILYDCVKSYKKTNPSIAKFKNDIRKLAEIRLQDLVAQNKISNEVFPEVEKWLKKSHSLFSFVNGISKESSLDVYQKLRKKANDAQKVLAQEKQETYIYLSNHFLKEGVDTEIFQRENVYLRR